MLGLLSRFRLDRYISYIFSSSDNKRQQLLSVARQDPFLAPVVESLIDFGFEAHFPWFGGPGAYRPCRLSVENVSRLQNDFLDAFQQNKMNCEFCFPSRFGPSITAHYWLHELIHFYQDSLGLFFTPLEIGCAMPVILDARSTIKVLLVCEAIAETEAIRMSWRLKEKGVQGPWDGVLLSFDWSQLARQYHDDRQADLSEQAAANNILKLWFETKQRLYYEARALSTYEKKLNDYKKAADLNDSDLLPYFRSIEEKEVFKLWHQKTNLFYGDIELRIKNSSVLRGLEHLESRYGVCTNNIYHDITLGSPAYLWRKFIKPHGNNKVVL